MITEPDDFFANGCRRCDRFGTPECSARLWGEGVSALRRLCLEAGLEETAKWGHPCYVHAGRNVAIIGAFRGDFRLTFFNAALMTEALDADPELAAAFGTLTPGRQRSYVINIQSAKASATRARRIEKFRDKIIAGKGANER